MKTFSKLFFSLSLAVLVQTTAVAQTYEDVVKGFNEGYQLVKDSKNAEAKAKFYEVIKLSTTVGAEADEIKKKAESQIPPLQYKIAADVYKKKDVPGAINAFKEAMEVSIKFKDAQIEKKSKDIIPKLYYTLGNSFFKQEKLDEALVNYKEAIALEPNYGKAFYQIGLVYKGKDDLDSTLISFDKAIEIGLATNDRVAAREAEGSARDLLVFKGVKKIEAKRYDEAIALLNKAINYDSESADVFYRLAEANNKKSVFDLAIEYANKALKFEKGGKTDRAKVWFELGYAYKNKGNKSAACEAFEQAAFGQFKTVAEHEMQHELKCKSTTGK